MSSEQKVAIITGASQGIGAGLVKAFRDRNYRVVATSRSIEQTGDQDIVAVRGDVGDPATAEAVVWASDLAVRADRHAGQQCRHLHRQILHRLHGRGLRHQDRDQSRRLLPHHAAGRDGDAQAGIRPHRQHHHEPRRSSEQQCAERDLARQPRDRLSSSRLAARKRSGEPKCWRMLRLRAGPDAGQVVEHRARHRLVAAAAVELDREPVRLVARALEQLELRACRAAAAAARARPGTNTSSIRLARLTTVTPRSRNGPSSLRPADSWPLPPSITISAGQRREALVVLLLVRASARAARRTAPSAVRAPRSWPRSHPERPPGCRSGGSRTSSARRPRTRPSRRPCASRIRFEMSKHSIRIGIASIAERALEPLERLDPLRAAALGAQPVLVEREPRVALGQLEDAALVAALGVAHLDRARRGARRAPRASVVGVGNRARDDHLRRDRDRAARSTGARTPRRPRPRRGRAAFSR